MLRWIRYSVIAMSAGFMVLCLAWYSTGRFKPSIQMDPELAYDFGRIHMGTAVYHQFAVHNRHPKAFRILETWVGCHCTTVDGPATSVVLPGQAVRIGVHFVPTVTGVQSQVVIVHTDDLENPKLYLRLRGEVTK